MPCRCTQDKYRFCRLSAIRKESPYFPYSSCARPFVPARAQLIGPRPPQGPPTPEISWRPRREGARGRPPALGWPGRARMPTQNRAPPRVPPRVDDGHAPSDAPFSSERNVKHASKERFHPRVGGVCTKVLGCSDLDDLARAHHSHPVGQLQGLRKVVRHKDRSRLLTG